MTTIGRCVLHVSDLDRAVDFYREALGFEVVLDREIRPGFRSVHVGPGSITDPGVWLFPVEEVPVVDEPRLVVYTDDVEADARHIAGMGADVLIPLTGAPGERFLQVRDPSGNVVVVAERPPSAG